jgi:ADP-heptose:LPS heptosyltransferase
MNEPRSVLDAQLQRVQRDNDALARESSALRERLATLEAGRPPMRELVRYVGGKLAERARLRADDERARLGRALAARGAATTIALSAYGGMGDALWATAIIEAIARKHAPAELHVLVYEPVHAAVLRDNPLVAGVYLVDRAGAQLTWPQHLRRLLARGQLDLWYESRYATRVHYGARARVSNEERAATERAFADLAVNFDEFPLGNNLVSLHARRRGLPLLPYVAKSAALTLDDPQLFIYPSADDAAILSAVDALGPYVTVHHGADTFHVQSGQQTKNWSRASWQVVIAGLRARGLTVVQLGTANETPLDGARHDFLGGCTPQQTALLLRGARFHLDSEGGLVHLARATHTPSLVLFGPTPIDFFGYAQNVNLHAGDCHGCWWAVDSWQASCPRGLARAACMEAIEPGVVLAAAEQLAAATTPTPRRHELLDASACAPDDAADYVRAQLGDAARASILEVSPAPSRVAHVLAARGLLAQHCQLGPSSAPRGDARTTRFGSPFCLPYETGSRDVVIAFATAMGERERRYANRELLRVLAPGGLLMLLAPIAEAPRLLAGLAVDGAPALGNVPSRNGLLGAMTLR